jgi:hypothetical protein
MSAVCGIMVLSPDAAAYYDGLEQRRLNGRHNVRKSLAQL